MENDNVEIFNGDNIVTLYDDNNNPVDFFELACVELDDKYYGIMQPVEPLDGLGEDEVLIFEIQESEDDDSDRFISLTDEVLLERIFNEFMKAVADQECECDCEDCHHGDCEDEECGCHHDHCDCHNDNED